MRILSIDDGGIRGLILTRLVTELVLRVGSPLVNHFDPEPANLAMLDQAATTLLRGTLERIDQVAEAI